MNAPRMEKKEYIKLLGFELKGYSLKKLVVQILLGILTVSGVIREELIHSRHSEQIAELARREQKCEDRLDDALRKLEGKQFPPTNRAFVPVDDSHNEAWRKILWPQPLQSPLDIRQNSPFGQPVSGKPDGRLQ